MRNKLFNQELARELVAFTKQQDIHGILEQYGIKKKPQYLATKTEITINPIEIHDAEDL
jgi:hypothetical protein